MAPLPSSEEAVPGTLSHIPEDTHAEAICAGMQARPHPNTLAISTEQDSKGTVPEGTRVGEQELFSCISPPHTPCSGDLPGSWPRLSPQETLAELEQLV